VSGRRRGKAPSKAAKKRTRRAAEGWAKLIAGPSRALSWLAEHMAGFTETHPGFVRVEVPFKRERER
jgi:hypothetical protein